MKTIWISSLTKVTLVVTGLLLPGAAAAGIDIEHEALKKVKSGVRAQVESKISGDSEASGIRDARAYFKTQPAERFYFIPLRPDQGGGYSGVFPAMAPGTESFEYFVLARSNDDEIVKTDMWTVKVKDDEEALARMERKPPREVKIDVDRIQEAEDLVDDSRKVTDADRSRVARQGGEPDATERVEVRTETPDLPTKLAGIDDYVNLQVVGPSEVVGSAAISQATTVNAGGAGLSGATIGGLAAAGAVGVGAAAAGGSSDDGGSTSVTSTASGGGSGTSPGSSSGTSPFAGSLSGAWSGECLLGPVNGAFSVTISGNGSITGTFSGDDSGTLSGSVPDSGQVSLSANGSASSGCTWSGTFTNTGSGLSGSGNWGSCDSLCFGGTWSGSG